MSDDVGIADVWMCPACGRFEFTKPEAESERPLVCAWCNLEMSLLPDQAVIATRPR